MLLESERYFRRLLPVACLLAAGCGAGSDGPTMVPASGEVTLNGKPLDGAQVAFHPVESTPGRGGFAQSDGDGKFQLGNPSPSGLVAGVPSGKYKVTVSKQRSAAMSASSPNAATAATVDGVETLPPRFSDFSATTLTADVPQEGKNDIRIELRTK